MRTSLSYGAALVLMGLAPMALWAAPKAKETYDVRPSSQTVKRRQSALELGNAKDASQAGPKLLQALGDKDPMTRSLAVRSLGSLKYKAARANLGELLVKDPSAEVREAAAVALRQIEDPQAVDNLGKAINDPSVNVRVTVLMSLAHYRVPQSRIQVEAACKDKAPEVRRTALYALGRLEDPASTATVQGLLKDADASVRAVAAQTLGELHATGSQTDLESLLKDSDKAVQASAARSLLMLGHSSGFQTAQVLAKDSDFTVRLLAIDALGWSKDPAAETQLKSLLAEAPSNSRVAVQEALARTQQLRKR